MIKFSPRFGYKLSKTLDGIAGGGSTDWWEHRVAKLYGNCPEALCPTKSTKDTTEKDYIDPPITIEAFFVAYQFRISYYQRLYGLDECLRALLVSPIGISFDCFSGIHTAPNGQVPMPSIGEEQAGSHSVAVYGYSQSERHVKFLNSWGPDWGDKGHGYLPFDYFEEGLVSSIWSQVILTAKQKEEGNRGTYFLKDKNRNSFKIEHFVYPEIRNAGSPFHVLDIYSHGNIHIGCLHFSIKEDGCIEIEEFFILPDYQQMGIGSATIKLLKKILKTNKIKKIVGWIGAQDLIGEREKKVVAFYCDNGFDVIEDFSRFRDCFYRIEKNLD